MKGRVLVVDDDRSLVRVAERLLQKQGFDVLTAFDGREGLQKAQEEKPDVIVLDIFMPDMDGYSTLWAIKKAAATKDIPVVMLTAVDYELNRRMAQESGAAAYIAKPLNPPELLDVIAGLLGSSEQPRGGHRPSPLTSHLPRQKRSESMVKVERDSSMRNEGTR